MKRAKVDYWLDWNNTTCRPNCTPVFYMLVINPLFFNIPAPDEDKKKELMDKYHNAMKVVETAVSDQDYLTGKEYHFRI